MGPKDGVVATRGHQSEKKLICSSCRREETGSDSKTSGRHFLVKDLSRQRLLDPVGSMVNVEKEEKKSKFETKCCPPLFSTTFLSKKGVRTKLSKSNLVN